MAAQADGDPAGQNPAYRLPGHQTHGSTDDDKESVMAGSCPFDGKTALLFRGAKGIGRAVALESSRRGARLAVADIDQAATDSTAAEIVTALRPGDRARSRCDERSLDRLRRRMTRQERARIRSTSS